MKKEYLGIDLGSENTVIYSYKQNRILFQEPTCIALDSRSGQIKEVGYLASKIEGKTPFPIKIIYPIRRGLVNDDDALYRYLSSVFHQLHLDLKHNPTTLVLTAPSLCGKTDRKVLIQVAKKLFTKEVFIEPEAKRAALGSCDKAYTPNATLVRNIGSGVTDTAILSLGEIVSWDTSFISGDSFSEAIRRYRIQKQHLSIGRKTSSYIKRTIGTLSKSSSNKLIEVKGRDTLTSLPSSILISSGEIKNVLAPLADYLVRKVTDVIASVSPELAADLTKTGLTLTGGGALLSGLKDYFRDALSIPVHVADNPELSVAVGLKNYISHREGK